MFEKIRAYKNLKKADKFFKDVKTIAEIINDEEMLCSANEVLYLNQVMKRKIIFNNKIARKYNLEFIRKGF